MITAAVPPETVANTGRTTIAAPIAAIPSPAMMPSSHIRAGTRRSRNRARPTIPR